MGEITSPQLSNPLQTPFFLLCGFHSHSSPQKLACRVSKLSPAKRTRGFSTFSGDGFQKGKKRVLRAYFSTDARERMFKRVEGNEVDRRDRRSDSCLGTSADAGEYKRLLVSYRRYSLRLLLVEDQQDEVPSSASQRSSVTGGCRGACRSVYTFVPSKGNRPTLLINPPSEMCQ